MNKISVIIAIVVVIIAGGYFLLKEESAPVSMPVSQEIAPAQDHIITYTDTGYSPNTLQVKVGTTVTFKNGSSRSMWVASGVHPTHRLYPTTGGCLGSTFDACRGIQPGDSWPFTFDIAGTWKYHNHLKPSDAGTIIVEQ